LPDLGLTRREFLKVAGTGVAGAALLGAAGCGPVEEIQQKLRRIGGPNVNVVVIILDSLRKDHIGAYGSRRVQTPNIDALAAESLRFTSAYPESLPTIPARRAIHTGLRSFPFRGWDPPGQDFVPLYGWQPIPEGQTTLAETLRGAGFTTMLITDTLHMFRPFYNFHRGFDVFHFVRGQERDFFKPQWMAPQEKLDNALIGGPASDHMEDILHQYFANTSSRKSEEDWFAPQVFMRAAEFLEGAAKSGDPFFMVVDAYDPHEPWDAPEEYVALYDEGYEGPEPMSASSGDSGWLTERQLQRMKALYAAEVTMADRWLGHFMDKFDALKLGEDTLLVFLSDHGHAFGEHGVAGKVPSAMYPEIVEIPFLVRHPDGTKGGTSTAYHASTHDVTPTVLGFLGLEPERELDGVDLSKLFDDESPPERPYVTAGYHDHVWARDDEHVMMSANDGSEARLFDIKTDPEQTRNLASERPDTVKRMYEDYILKDAGGPLPNYDA
jgi:arylsulfatase A-like enzyme